MSRSRVVNLANFQQFTAINVLSDPGASAGPVVIPNAAKFMLVWQLADGKIGRNVLGGIVQPSFIATATLAEAFRAAVVSGATWSALAAFLPTTVSLLRTEIQDIRSAGMTPVASTGASTPGTSASPALPSEVALVMTLRTARIGAQFRGRMYMPGWATNAIGAGDVAAAAAVTALQNFANNISTGISAGGGQWALLQPERQEYLGVTGTLHPARAANALPISATVVRDNHWDSQRRRGQK